MPEDEKVTNSAQAPGKPPAPEPGLKVKSSSKLPLWIGLAVLAVAVVGGGAWWYMQAHAKPVVVERTVKIGVFEPLAGDLSTFGMALKQGVDLAHKRLSSPGLHVELVTVDTACDKDKAIQAVKDLAAQGVVAIIGADCSGPMLAAAPTANELHVPMVSSSATNPKVTDAGDYIFRVIPSDAFAAEFTANLMYKRGLRKLAIIHGNEDYGNGLNTALSDAFKKAGGTVVASEAGNNGDPNVATQMQRIKAAGPDALYIAFNESTVVPVAILLKLKELGMTTPVFSSETLKDPVFLKDAAERAEGLNVIAVSDGTPSFVELHQAAYKKDPDIYTAQSYDAYEAIFRALETGASTGTQVKDALYKVDFTGASGHVKFDANGDVPPNYTAYKVVSGKFVAQSN
jgi:branched-chain amino acid transport system substrate-binding protein